MNIPANMRMCKCAGIFEQSQLTMINNSEIKVAVLDLYNGIANQAIAGFEAILLSYSQLHNLHITWQVFDVRTAHEIPDLGFDLYLSSGGPGNPFSANEEWDKSYFKLIDKLTAYNATGNKPKKHMLFVCHSFQLLCRWYGLGEVSLRNVPSFGVLPVYLSDEGKNDPLFRNMDTPFYTVDSRSWQVINPNKLMFEKHGAKILAVEMERPGNLPRALMAVRFNDCFVGTQFHPEFGPGVMKVRLLAEDNKSDVFKEHGEDQYAEMLLRLNDPDRLLHTLNTVVPNFLDQAISELRKYVC